jgi:VIT1/CCC1 family predicted Fe2+/Mn2+ transporter
MPEIDLTQYVTLVAVIIGAVELITRLRAKDWWAAVTIGIAGLIGFLFGAANYYPGMDAVEGLVAGISASGVVTALGARRSTPAPSENVLTKK